MAYYGHAADYYDYRQGSYGAYVQRSPSASFEGSSTQIPFPQPQPYPAASTSTYYQQPPRYSRTPPGDPTYQQHYPVQSSYTTTPERRRRSKDWKDVLCMGRSMSALGLADESTDGAQYHKPLPPIPSAPPVPPVPPVPSYSPVTDVNTRKTTAAQPSDRPASVPARTGELRPPPIPPRPHTTSQPLPSTLNYPAVTPLKSFKPTFHPNSAPHQTETSSSAPEPRPDHVGHHRSALVVPSKSTQNGSTPKTIEVIDLTGDSPPATPTRRRKSPDRRQRATSETPRSKTAPTFLPAVTSTAKSPSRGSPSSTAVRCAGYTRTGQPCKRLVKVVAPFLASRPDVERGAQNGEGDDEHPKFMGRYCKDHAGMVCKAGGFYWRGKGGKAGIWVDFDDYIPPDLGQQTQTLLRMTMETPLTAKEMPGFLYAYELRDLQTDSTSFYKVGRTDNVPRRIGQWTKQCQSHTPTLRDIFPLPLSRTPTILRPHHPNHKSTQQRTSGPTSFLPGAVHGGTLPHTRNPDQPKDGVKAVKRWERLVHLELFERASQSASNEWDRLRKGGEGGGCSDCGAIHKEIFPLAKVIPAYQFASDDDRVNGRTRKAYEDIVLEVICRWERFIRLITED